MKIFFVDPTRINIGTLPNAPDIAWIPVFPLAGNDIRDAFVEIGGTTDALLCKK